MTGRRLKAPLYVLPHGIEVIGEYAPNKKCPYWRVRVRPHPLIVGKVVHGGVYIRSFGSIRFFTKDADSPLMFVVGGLGDLEVFGGIMKVRDSFEQLPQWFPRPTNQFDLTSESFHREA